MARGRMTALVALAACTPTASTGGRGGGDDAAPGDSDCGEPCARSVALAGPFAWPGESVEAPVVAVEAGGVERNPDGELVMASEPDDAVVWVPNTAEGTISKVDARTGRELARYSAVTRESLVDVMGVSEETIATGLRAEPSRVGIDAHGDVWLANLAEGRQPSATKIAAHSRGCADRDSSGVVQTSSDANGDGRIDLGDPIEYVGESDECIVFTVVVGSAGGLASAVAIAAPAAAGHPGNAWIGMRNEQAFYELDGTSGALVRRVPDSGTGEARPYGAVIDSLGYLWALDGCCASPRLWRVDTSTGASAGLLEASGLSCSGSFGITLDARDRVWLGGWSCNSAIRFDPASSSWTEVDLAGLVGDGWYATGAAADARGSVWLALHPLSGLEGRVARINADTATATGAWDVAGGSPRACGADTDGNIWTANWQSSNVSRLAIDAASGEPAAHPITGNVVDTFPVGYGPDAHGELTPAPTRRGARRPSDYAVTLEGCAGGAAAEWRALRLERTVPAGTAVEVRVHGGDDLSTLAARPSLGPWLGTEIDLGAAPGPLPASRYMRVTVRLASLDRETTPTVHEVHASWRCPPL